MISMVLQPFLDDACSTLEGIQVTVFCAATKNNNEIRAKKMDFLGIAVLVQLNR